MSSSSSDRGSGIATPNNADSPNISPNAAGGNNKVPDGSITTSKLADGAVTNPKLALDAVTTDKIQDGEVNTDSMAYGAITSSKANFIRFHTTPSCSDEWNPRSGQANMDIAGLDLNDIIESSVIIVNVNDGNHGSLTTNCGVYDKFVQSSPPFNPFAVSVM